MDKPLSKPRNTRARRFRQRLLIGLALLALVLIIGSLPLLFIYFWNMTGAHTGTNLRQPRSSRPPIEASHALLHRR